MSIFFSLDEDEEGAVQVMQVLTPHVLLGAGHMRNELSPATGRSSAWDT